MKPIPFPGSNAVFGANQPEYLPLPALAEPGQVTACWGMSFRERLKLLFTGQVWQEVLTFGKPLQPTKLSVDRPNHLGAAR